MGGMLQAVEEGFKRVELSGKRIGHVAIDSEGFVAEVINFIQQKETSYKQFVRLFK